MPSSPLPSYFPESLEEAGWPLRLYKFFQLFSLLSPSPTTSPFFFLPTCQYSWALLIPAGGTDPAPVLSSFYWGTDVSLAGVQPGNRSVANELAGRTKHCSSPGTILSSIVGTHKTSGFGKEQMPSSLLVCLRMSGTPVHHILNVCLITELMKMTKG